jgi:hypothetical protein
MKNTQKYLPVGSSMRRNAKKRSSTPKAKKPRSTRRYVEVKIKLSAEEYTRGQLYFGDQKYLSKFFLDAYTEKVNRAESNNKAARLRIIAGNMDLLEPVLKEMWQQGKLNFLSGLMQEENNG